MAKSKVSKAATKTSSKTAAKTKAKVVTAPQDAEDFEEAIELKSVTKAPKAKKGQENSELITMLDKILEAELSGVVRYLHYSFMIFGPTRIPITKWFRAHATEGMDHAVIIGEKITALGGHPSVTVQPVPETNKHSVLDILKESMQFEDQTLAAYKEVLGKVGEDIALEEMIRKFISEETAHIEEVKKMLRSK